MQKSTTTASNEQRLSRGLRIRKRGDFQRVYARKCWVSDDVLRVAAGDNGLRMPRLGLSVSKKHGTAVRRNRWKRLIREAFRLSLCELPTGLDLVVSPREQAEPELRAIRGSLISLGRRAAKRLSATKR